MDYRPYQPGDDFRRVDWNVYGRLGSLQMKVTEGRERLDVLVVLDCSSSMATGSPDKLEFAAQVAAALAYIGMARADSVSVVCLGSPPKSFGPFDRRARLPDLARSLQQIAPVGFVDLSAQLLECASRSTLMVIVSDLLSPEGIAIALEALAARRFDVAVVHVVSPDEMDPRIRGEVELIDAETGERLELGVSLNTLAAYRARFSGWLDERLNECRARGIRYARVHSDRPLASVVLEDLRRAEILR